MSKAEKRQFRLFCSIHKESDSSNYLKLFDFLDKQSEFNEEKFKSKFSKSTELAVLVDNKRTLSATTRYLYKMIIKSARVHNEISTNELKVRHAIDEITYLCERELYDLAAQRIVSVKKQALENYLHRELLSLYSLERLIANRVVPFKKLKDTYEVLQAEEQEAIDWVYRMNRLKTVDIHLWLKSYGVSQAGTIVLEPWLVEELEWIKENEKIFEQHLVAHLLSKHALTTLARVQQNYFRCVDLTFEMLDIIEHNSNKTQTAFINYSRQLVNLVSYLYETGETRRLEEVWERLERIPEIFSKGAIRSNQVIYEFLKHNTNLLIHSSRGTYSACLPVIEEIKSWLNSPSGRKLESYKKQLILVKSASIMAATGDPSKCLEVVNEVINSKDFFKTTSEMALTCEMIRIICHLELNNDTIIPHLVDKAKRMIRKNPEYFQVETLLCDLALYQIPKAANSKEEVECYKSLRKEVNLAVSNGNTSMSLVHIFDLVKWMAAKISGQPMDKAA